MFHAVKALIFTLGLEPRSHGGVNHYFNSRFVGTDDFPTKWGRFFNRLMKYRHEADYGLIFEIREKDCDEWFHEVSVFIEKVRVVVQYDQRGDGEF